MQPLLKIQSIPIKIEAQTRRASLQHSTEPAPISKPAPLSNMLNRGGRRAAPQTPVQITGAPSNPAPQAENAAPQRQAEYAAISAAPQQPAYSGGSGVEQPAASVADTVIGQTLLANTAPAPQAQAPAPAPAPSAPVNYQMDKPTFDWNSISKPQLEFVPAQIEYSITQYPQLIIEYVGEPIYVPASANPNYKGTA